MIRNGIRLPVSMAQAFPAGCCLVPDSITEAQDYDERIRTRSPSVDKLTGKRVFQVRVSDLDPDLAGRSREVVVKVLADRMPAAMAGRPLDPRNVSRSWYSLRDRAGLGPVRFHDLRHSCASFLIAAGASPRTVMKTLGHSQISLTMNTYAHVLPEVERAAVDAAAQVIFGAQPDAGEA